MAAGSAAEGDGPLARFRGCVAAHLPHGGRLCVALSGGMDSVVLLDVAARWAAREGGVELSALHVDHGISPRSGEWADFCAKLCSGRGIPLRVVRADLDPSGPGLEERAREARREAYARCGAGHVALAHHLDDQAETFVFRALRGTGVAGLACMAPAAGLPSDPPVTLLRPLLSLPRSELLRYAQGRGLEWREDESNLDEGITRNFIRRSALPLMEGRFPHYRRALDATLSEARDSAALLRELAEMDSELALDAGADSPAWRGARMCPDTGIPDGLDARAWRREHFRRVGERRTANWLRHVHAADPGAPAGRQLREAARQICLPAGRAEGFSIRARAGRLASYGDRLYVVRCPRRGDGRRGESARIGFREGAAHEDELGIFVFRRDDDRGIRASDLRGGRVELRPRKGGERIAKSREGRRRALKDLLREAGVPPWDRAALPLLYVDGELAAVPNVAVAAGRLACGAEGYFPHWRSKLCGQPPVPAGAPA